MATLTDGDILQFVMHYNYQGQRLLNTWHYKVQQFEVTEVPYEDYCAEIFADLIGAGEFVERLVAELADSCTLVKMTLQKVYPTRLRAIVSTIDEPGTAAGTGSTVNQAAVITKYAEISARYAVGSWHQGGLPASAYTSSGLVSGEVLDDLVEALDMLLNIDPPAGYPGTDLVSILWNSLLPGRITPISGITPQTTARVMRRRTVGLGI